MYYVLKWLYHLQIQFGINLLQMVRALKGVPDYCRNYLIFKRQHKKPVKEFQWGKVYPCLADRYEASGSMRGHYFHQDLWAAQRICAHNPEKHVDIGSRIDGFVAHVAAFREIEVWDIRPPENRVKNIKFRQMDIMDAQFGLDNYCDSVSSLSVLEHLGLGRYGDQIDYHGYLTGWEHIYRMLKSGGKFYFSVPIGPQRIEFDAHRVFSIPYLLSLMERKYRLDTFAYVDDQGRLVQPVSRQPSEEQQNFSCHFGCGLFELTKVGE